MLNFLIFVRLYNNSIYSSTRPAEAPRAPAGGDGQINARGAEAEGFKIEGSDFIIQQRVVGLAIPGPSGVRSRMPAGDSVPGQRPQRAAPGRGRGPGGPPLAVVEGMKRPGLHCSSALSTTTSAARGSTASSASPRGGAWRATPAAAAARVRTSETLARPRDEAAGRSRRPPSRRRRCQRREGSAGE